MRIFGLPLRPLPRHVLPVILCGRPPAPQALIMARPLSLNPVGKPAEHHDLSGFLRRATARIERHRKSPYLRGQPDAMTDLFLPSDSMWINALRIQSAGNLHQAAPLQAKLAMVMLEYKDAFRLLEDMGLLVENENPTVWLSTMDMEFSPEICEQAAETVKKYEKDSFDWSNRVDMTNMICYTIDDPYTTETDDGISIEVKGGQTWVHVHVADPTAYLHHMSALNLSAMSRATTIYLPELRAMMFPPSITNTLFSIEPGKRTPVFTVSFRYDERGEIVDYRIQNAVVEKVQKLTYEETQSLLRKTTPQDDPLHQHGPVVRQIGELARRHMRCRFWDHDAFGINMPVPKIFVDRLTGKVNVSMRYDYLVESRSLVAEMMISAGRAVAMYCIEHKIPVPFRSQPSSYCPHHILHRLRASSYALVPSLSDLFRVLPYMARARTAAVVGHHYTLGIPAYTKVTSPIRRYTDMLTHYQVKAHLEGRPLPYTREQLEKILINVMTMEEEHDLLQSLSERFWSLKFQEEEHLKDPKPLKAAVLQTEPDGMYHQIFLVDTALRARVWAPREFEPGEEVMVQIRNIDYKQNRFSVVMA